MLVDLLVENIEEIVTNEGLADGKNFYDDGDNNLLGIKKDAWLACYQGKVVATGLMKDLKKDTFLGTFQVVDAYKNLVMPGFIDAHTHPLFAGDRSHEFCARLNGESYQSIAAKGGGILSSVRSTRQASDLELQSQMLNRLKRFFSYGVTTVECKSGYGLSVAEELRHLRLMNKVKKLGPQTLKLSCLALHAFSPEFSSPDDYIKAVQNQLLPELAREKLCDFVDAFVELGYYTPEMLDDFFSAVKNSGLSIRVHADEFADSGAAKAAAKWGALSADHLQAASDEGLAAMGASGVIGVLLPGTSLYCGIPFAKAERFRKHKISMALATDFNPGSCAIDNIGLIACLGAVHCGLTAPEAIAAITYNAAKSLGLQSHKGALCPSYDADFCVIETTDHQKWLASAGSLLPKAVFIAGEQIDERNFMG